MNFTVLTIYLSDYGIPFHTIYYEPIANLTNLGRIILSLELEYFSV